MGRGSPLFLRRWRVCGGRLRAASRFLVLILVVIGKRSPGLFLFSLSPRAFLGFLTVLETLRLYASFHEDHRGVRQTIEQIGLVEQEQVQARNLSGGQLR